MTSPTSRLPARIMLCAALGLAAVLVVDAPRMVDAQGLVKGVEKGAREGNKAAGPVGGVLGGAIGGVVGVVSGVTSVLTGKGDQPAQNDKDKKGAAKTAKGAPGAPKGTKQPVQVLTQAGAPQLTAEQIVATSDANIERIKTELSLNRADAQRGTVPGRSCSGPAQRRRRRRAALHQPRRQAEAGLHR
jgi:hypothetical protein